MKSLLQVMVKLSTAAIVLLLFFSNNVNAYNTYTLEGAPSLWAPNFVALEHGRTKRDAPVVPASPVGVALNVTDSPAINNTTYETNDSSTTTGPTPPVAVTKIPLLGRNGTGILRVDLAGNTPQVSEPILPDETLTNVFKETPELMQAEQNITDLKYDHHNFYNSTFIGNVTYFNEYWANLTKQQSNVHVVLSNSYRRATTLRLTFDFPFYGHPVHNITVATGGFIYTGEHVHNWLAATQYIAPLMANFDTTLTNDSFVKMYNDGEKFTSLWENVTLQEDANKKFTFAVTLYKGGDIEFAYKDIPIRVQDINDQEHPVKVGISDAYLTDRIVFLVRRKTIYEYHRVSFKNYEVSNNTILRLTALPTCLQYDTCESCVNHETGFDCLWCDAIQKCSSGTDRNKQDWMLRSCEKSAVGNETGCPARPPAEPSRPAGAGGTAYVTDHQPDPVHTPEINTIKAAAAASGASSGAAIGAASGTASGAAPARSSVGGAVVGAFAAAALCALVGWTFYAFKNPHTRSGQILIKYRPSQWGWRRGEARYTAATIHM